LRRQGEVELAPIEPDRISDQYGDKRQAKYSGHLRLGRINFSKRVMSSPGWPTIMKIKELCQAFSLDRCLEMDNPIASFL
jgi:hypothetical protein